MLSARLPVNKHSTSNLLTTEFVVLTPEKCVHIEKFDSARYVRLDTDYNQFKGHQLVASHYLTQDWDCWEMHPYVDEVIVLLAGSVELLFTIDQKLQSNRLNIPGSFLIALKGDMAYGESSSQRNTDFYYPGQRLL